MDGWVDEWAKVRGRRASWDELSRLVTRRRPDQGHSGPGTNRTADCLLLATA
jgi:hypothetical protein